MNEIDYIVRSSPRITKEKALNIYKVYEIYKNKVLRGSFDIMDVVNHIISEFDKGLVNKNLMNLIYMDEVIVNSRIE